MRAEQKGGSSPRGGEHGQRGLLCNDGIQACWFTEENEPGESTALGTSFSRSETTDVERTQTIIRTVDTVTGTSHLPTDEPATDAL